MAPPMDARLQGGTRINGLAGVNLIAPEGPLTGHRLALEVGAPLYEDLDGPRLGTETVVTLGWQKTF